jgi:hypothetical protein
VSTGELGLFDGRGRPILPPFPLPPIQIWVNVAVRVLSSGDERRALVIPVGSSPTAHAPMPTGTYRLRFALDRARWRSLSPDTTTNYRANHTLAVAW